MIREKEIKKADESKAKDFRKQQQEKKAMEVEERKLKRAVEKAEKERQKKLKKVKRVHQNLNLQEKSTVSFVGGMRMVMIYLTSDTKKKFHHEELSLDTTACKSSGVDIGLSEVDENSK